LGLSRRLTEQEEKAWRDFQLAAIEHMAGLKSLSITELVRKLGLTPSAVDTLLAQRQQRVWQQVNRLSGRARGENHPVAIADLSRSLGLEEDGVREILASLRNGGYLDGMAHVLHACCRTP
jgi:DNA-binding IclR family transcriptional regulator